VRRVYPSASDAETQAIGAELATLLRPPRMLILTGDLGAGKTTLVKGLVAALEAGDEDAVTSPTFTLVHSYDGWQDGQPVQVVHLDLYRLETEQQLATLGLADLLVDDALVLVEWGEKFASVVQMADGIVRIERPDATHRLITLETREA
jgi:tRNA threonylcarbamoyladenosine biosynthesis protein TsaE